MTKEKSNEWYPCYIATWMWKQDSGLPPRIVWFQVDNEYLHQIEDWLNEIPEVIKL